MLLFFFETCEIAFRILEISTFRNQGNFHGCIQVFDKKFIGNIIELQKTCNSIN